MPTEALSPDFDALALEAYPRDAERGPREALQTLWRELLALPIWEFAVHPGDVGNPRAFIANHDNQDCVFAFTDADRATEFARAHDLLDANGDSYRLSLALPGVFDWLTAAADRGEFSAVQFNFGRIAWFSPVSQLLVIREHIAGLPSA